MYTPANPYDVQFSGANRSYNKVGAQNQTNFNMVYNPFYQTDAGITGQWQPITTDNQGALRVTIGTGLQISASITGVTVNIPPSTAVTGVVNVTGQIAITNPLVAVSGAVQATITNPVVAVTGTINSSVWQKVASSGYVGVFSPLAAPALVNKINGLSKAGATSSFILVYDGVTGAGNFPIASIGTQPGANWFIDLAEAGVQFNTNLTIINSTDAITPVNSGPADFFATAVYR